MAVMCLECPVCGDTAWWSWSSPLFCTGNQYTKISHEAARMHVFSWDCYGYSLRVETWT